jgi:hypothetical protein
VEEYHKVQSVYLRDPETKNKRFLVGQYAKPEFEYLANNQWLFTEKVDGTNIRVMIMPFVTGELREFSVLFCGKTNNSQLTAKLVARLEQRFHKPGLDRQLAEMFPAGACLYGEGYGAGIQSGGNYRKEQDFILFDVKIGDFWLERPNVEDIADKLGLDIVPIIGSGTLPDMVAKARLGFESRWEGFKAEGIVARPMCELKTRAGERIITKVKYKDFA